MNNEKTDRERRRNAFTVLLSILGFLSYFIICSFIAYGLTIFIFNITGEPPRIVAFMISAFLTFVVIVGLAHVHVRLHHRNQDWPRNKVYTRVMEDTLQAMNRIAQGDFHVFIEDSERDPYHELAMRVNQMAKELSSMETLRQDFVSNISHEIQSPLTSISGYATLLERGDLTVVQRNHYLHIIKTESDRLSKLSKNILKLSSLDAGAIPLAKQQFRLDNQLQKVTVLLEPQWFKKNITVEAELDNLSISGDEELLSQAWINLINNAIKFTPEGGNIQITLTADEKNIHCTIADTGIGISAKDQIHIFERFYKVDKSRDRSLGGNGLGLSLVKKIVALHNGTIAVASEVEKGTTFTVSFPLV